MVNMGVPKSFKRTYTRTEFDAFVRQYEIIRPYPGTPGQRNAEVDWIWENCFEDIGNGRKKAK